MGATQGGGLARHSEEAAARFASSELSPFLTVLSISHSSLDFSITATAINFIIIFIPFIIPTTIYKITTLSTFIATYVIIFKHNYTYFLKQHSYEYHLQRYFRIIVTHQYISASPLTCQHNLKHLPPFLTNSTYAPFPILSFRLLSLFSAGEGQAIQRGSMARGGTNTGRVGGTSHPGDTLTAVTGALPYECKSGLWFSLLGENVDVRVG